MPSTGLGQLGQVKTTAKNQSCDLKVSDVIFTPYPKITSNDLQLQLTREKEVDNSEKVRKYLKHIDYQKHEIIFNFMLKL